MVALAPIPFYHTLSSRGASEAARFVTRQAEQSGLQLGKSFSFGMRGKGVLDELYQVFEECREPNWDGYSAAQVSDEAYRLAAKFLDALPFGIPAPSVGAEADGHVTLEWYCSPRQTLSVSVGPDGDLHYAALLGLRKAYGTEPFGEAPIKILELIKQVMAA